MADKGRSDFYVVFTMSLCALRFKKTFLNKLAILNCTALKLGVQALRSYLKVTCKYELYILPDTIISAAKDHSKNYMKVRPPMVCHILRNVCVMVHWPTVVNMLVTLSSEVLGFFKGYSRGA